MTKPRGRVAGLRPNRIFFFCPTKARLVNPAVEAVSTTHLFGLITPTMIRASNSPPVQGGKVPNQSDDELSSTSVLTGLPCMGARCMRSGFVSSRSIQYNFTASLRAMATFATLPPRRCFNR